MTFGKTLNWNACIGNNGNYIFRTMTEDPNISRKRRREDDSSEFTPLSKRINNLHINNGLADGSIRPDHINGQESSHGNVDHGISSPSSSSDSDRQPGYDPGLNAADSTYYFDNKLLFELHLERIQRSGQQFPF